MENITTLSASDEETTMISSSTDMWKNWTRTSVQSDNNDTLVSVPSFSHQSTITNFISQLTETSTFYSTAETESILGTSEETMTSWLKTTESSTAYSVDQIGSDLSIDIISAEKLPIYIPAIIYTALLILIGIPGNLIVCYVYHKKWSRGSTRIFILALASLDLVNCFVTLPMEIAMLARPLKFNDAISCKISRFSTYLCNTSAALVLVAIAVDRFQRICRPLEKTMTSKTAKMVFFATLLVAILTTWPSLVIYGVQTLRIPTPSKILHGHICLVEDAFVKTSYPLIYFCFNCVCTFINVIILSVLYSFVGVQVCRRWRFRSKSVVSLGDSTIDEDEKINIKNSSSDQQSNKDLLGKKYKKAKTKRKGGDDVPPSPGAIKMVFISAANTLTKKKKSPSDAKVLRIGKTTLTLFIVTLVYVISFMPFLGIAIHRSIYPMKWINLSRGGEMAYNIFLRSYLLNSAVNPLVYSFCNDLFRKACVSLFRKMCRKTN